MRIEYDWRSHCWSASYTIRSTGRTVICDAESMTKAMAGLFVMVAEALS